MPLPRVTLTPSQLSAFSAKAPQLGREVQHGTAALNALGDTGAAAGALGRGVLRAGDAFLQAGQTGLKPIANAALQVGDQLINTSGGRHLMGATAIAAPILAATYHRTVQPYEQETMNIRQNPERVVTAASLDTFMSKIAAPVGLPPATGGFGQGGFGGEFAKGLGNAVGKTLVETAVNTLTSGAAALTDYLRNDGARKKLLNDMLHSDPVLSDAVRADPKASQHIMEAYQTLTRFAPALSLDPNAVRSFLREAVMSGGAVNYGTIKTLADTQKTILGPR